MKEIPPPTNEERMKEIKEYIRYLIEKVKRKDIKPISPTIYISDVEFLLDLMDDKGKREDKPLLLGPAVPMSGEDIDALIEREKGKLR